MIYRIIIKDKINRKYHERFVVAENHEDAVRVAMCELAKKVEKPYHFIECR